MEEKKAYSHTAICEGVKSTFSGTKEKKMEKGPKKAKEVDRDRDTTYNENDP